MTTLSTLTTPATTSGPTTPAFWERLWRMSGINFVIFFIIAYVIYGHQPQAGAPADALASFYDGDRTRILIASVFSGMARSARRDVSPAHYVRRSPRVFDRRLGKSRSHIGTERLRVGLRRDDFVSAGDVDHGWDLRTLAGQAHLKRALCSGSCSGRARVAGRHHVAQRWILVTLRRLFAVRLAHHWARVGPGREPGPLDPKSCYACWMVICKFSSQ
jgi:hypothetical protein